MSKLPMKFLFTQSDLDDVVTATLKSAANIARLTVCVPRIGEGAEIASRQREEIAKRIEELRH